MYVKMFIHLDDSETRAGLSLSYFNEREHNIKLDIHFHMPSPPL